MALGIAILIAAVGIGYALSRVARIRKELPELAEKQKAPRRKSRRERRLEQIRASEPEYVPPSIEELIEEEIAELGVNRIPGGEGVPPAVLLKVYRRDTARNEDCPPEDRRYRVTDGIEAGQAGVDDVRLICNEHPPAGSRRARDADPGRHGETSGD